MVGYFTVQFITELAVIYCGLVYYCVAENFTSQDEVIFESPVHCREAQYAFVIPLIIGWHELLLKHQVRVTTPG